MVPGRLTDAWRLALADAGIPADSVALVVYEQDPGADFPKAMFHAPNDLIDASYASRIGSSAASLTDRQVASARIACWEMMDDRLLLPVLRHELEHVHQWRSGGGAP